MKRFISSQASGLPSHPQSGGRKNVPLRKLHLPSKQLELQVLLAGWCPGWPIGMLGTEAGLWWTVKQNHPCLLLYSRADARGSEVPYKSVISQYSSLWKADHCAWASSPLSLSPSGTPRTNRAQTWCCFWVKSCLVHFWHLFTPLDFFVSLWFTSLIAKHFTASETQPSCCSLHTCRSHQKLQPYRCHKIAFICAPSCQLDLQELVCEASPSSSACWPTLASGTLHVHASAQISSLLWVSFMYKAYKVIIW